jgi:hypothetical protein
MDDIGCPPALGRRIYVRLKIMNRQGSWVMVGSACAIFGILAGLAYGIWSFYVVPTVNESLLLNGGWAYCDTAPMLK